MKALGQAESAMENRAERAIGTLLSDTQTVTYRAATAPVASPSYHAVESSAFAVARQGASSDMFLRLGGDEVAELVDHETASEAARRFGQRGFGPRLIGHDPDTRAMLFDYLGEGWRVAKIDDLMHEAPVARLVAIQKDIAAGAPIGRRWCVFDGVDTLWRLVSATSAPLPADIAWMLRWMTAMREAVNAAGVDVRPAHGDPHSSNVMIGPDGALMLVDFDMTGDMDPYYQLGVQMNELYQFESQMKPLLEMHDGRYFEHAFGRCRVYAAADDLYWALRSLLMSARSPLRGVEFLKYAAWRFLRCRMLLGLPGFEERLRSL